MKALGTTLLVAATLIDSPTNAANVVLQLRMDPVTPGCVGCTLSGPGTYQLLIRASAGDNFGISRYSIPVINATSLFHRSPRALVNPNDEALASGFTLLRTANNNAAIPGGFLVTAAQDVVTPTPYLVRGFGQEASSFAAKFPGEEIADAPLTQASWDANLLIAEGTYAAGLPPSIDFASLEITVGVFSAATGSGTMRANHLVVVPEPATISILGTTLVGLTLLRRRAVRRVFVTSRVPS